MLLNTHFKKKTEIKEKHGRRNGQVLKISNNVPSPALSSLPSPLFFFISLGVSLAHTNKHSLVFFLCLCLDVRVCLTRGCT